jgi:CheY-like chemotaxis protein
LTRSRGRPNKHRMARTILVVDDNDAFRGMLSSVLGARGYEVIAAKGGPAALAVTAERPVDAVLVDVEMPDMDGFEFCQQLRAQSGANQNVPVWIITGALRLGMTRRAAAVGAMLVLRKPLDVEETCRAFERAFNAGSAPDASGTSP